MAYDQEVGTMNLRAQFFDKVIKQVAKRMYKFKQAVTISPTNAWKNYFFRENTAVLAGASGNTTKGIPRGANFPAAYQTYERVSAIIEKYGLEQNIFYEDILSGEIDSRNRALYKITEGIVKSVDDEIYAELTENLGVASIANLGALANIQKALVSSGSTSGAAWNESSAAIIDDLMHAKQLIAEQNYDTSNLLCFISPKDHRFAVKYITDKGAQFNGLSNQTAMNGAMFSLAGITLIQSNSVPASMALVVVPRICGTWKELVPLQTTTKEDPYKSLLIRAVEMGTFQLTDPKSVVLLHGTQRFL